MQHPKPTVLILGATSFIGNVIYHEICQFMDTCGTYSGVDVELANNEAFYQLDITTTSASEILMAVQPSVIISCLEGDFTSQYEALESTAFYIASHPESSLLYMSSSKVFDAKFQFPSYEYDTPAADSDIGKFTISVEKLLLKTIPDQVAILRVPIVLGPYAPEIIHLREAIKSKANFEVFPNRIISITTANKVAQQVHYIIHKLKTGIFHLASEDVIHHEDLFVEICEKAHGKFPVFQQVFSRNEDSYLAILPKENRLPKNYRITVQEVINDCTLNEEIASLKL
jgi:dTDP-4-dehydrorhamnose reductase